MWYAWGWVRGKQYGNTPLMWAAYSGKPEVLAVALALAKQHVPADKLHAHLLAADSFNNVHFLHWAAEKGLLADAAVAAGIGALPQATLAEVVAATDKASARASSCCRPALCCPKHACLCAAGEQDDPLLPLLRCA